MHSLIYVHLSSINDDDDDVMMTVKKMTMSAALRTRRVEGSNSGPAQCWTLHLSVVYSTLPHFCMYRIVVIDQIFLANSIGRHLRG
jgi:hypothetical protein